MHYTNGQPSSPFSASGSVMAHVSVTFVVKVSYIPVVLLSVKK